MTQVEAFPLHWPAGYPRTAERKRSVFKGQTFFGGVKQILGEVRRLGGSECIVSTNIPLRKDGMPYSSTRIIHDPGVAVYFKLNSRPMVLACDKWERLEDNAHAIALTIEAMRATDRWGVSQMLERVFQGFTALPAPTPDRPWWVVLECVQHADTDFVEDQYRRLAKKKHPDLGGSPQAMSELNRAIEQARLESRP